MERRVRKLFTPSAPLPPAYTYLLSLHQFPHCLCFNFGACPRKKGARLFTPGVPLSPSIHVSYRNGSIRTLHLGACPYRTHSPSFSSVVVLLNSDFSRIELHAVDSRCANYLYHRSCFYNVPDHPPTLTTTQNPHCRDVCCNITLGPSITTYSLKEYLPFLDRKKHTQPGMGATEIRMYACLTQQAIVVRHARIT